MAKKITTKKPSFKPQTQRMKRRNIEEFMEIGGSPMPGIKLQHILLGHSKGITKFAWSPDGKKLATPSFDNTIRLWDISTGDCEAILEGHAFPVNSVSWSPDSQLLASGGDDQTVLIWNIETRQVVGRIEDPENPATSVTWSPNGNIIAIGFKSKFCLWDFTNRKVVFERKNESWEIPDISWSKNGRELVYQTDNHKLVVFNVQSLEEIMILSGHNQFIHSYDWSPQENILASGSRDKTIVLWNHKEGRNLTTIEAHTDEVASVRFSQDGKLLASKSTDQTVRIWRTDSFVRVAEIYESTANSEEFYRVKGGGFQAAGGKLGFHPFLPILATLGKDGTVVRLWELDIPILLTETPDLSSIRYTTAKLILVGDSGVGKTGLGWRLAHNEFKEHSSTHGQQFWVVPELKKTRKDGTECEAVLWDLAGQPDYRLVHSLYLDDVDTALVLFDPTNRQEPLAGVDFWLNQLRDKDKKLRSSILIGARTDRGTSTLTDSEIQAFCKRNNITGGYIATSAKEGRGLPALMETLKDLIPWGTLPATVTTATFKHIKEFVLALKEKPRRRKVLLSPEVLRKQLEKTDRNWKFTDEEMMTAVGHLEDHGYVKVLHGSNGEENILLSPDILANLASSFVLEARRNPRGLGVLEEERLLRGEYQFSELDKITVGERKILLDAAAVLFLEHNLCFRQDFNQQIFLVFPSLINEKRPADEGIKVVEGETYQVQGAVENLYASLVVLLGYTNTFVRTHQWQNHAQYEMGKGEICGFQQIGYEDAHIELVLNYGERTPDPVRLMFRGLFERFLSGRELEIARYQTVFCKNCGELLARNVVLDQLGKGKKFTFCHECGKKVPLPSPEPLTRLSLKEEVEIDVQEEIANFRTAFEAALVRVKGLLRDKKKKKKPTCFVSYAWGISENERWVLQFAKDLRNADVNVLLDQWDSPMGSNLDLYIDRILSSDFVIPVGTPELRKKYDTKKRDPVVAAELKLINVRVRQPSEYGNTVLPILLAGSAKTSFTPQLQPLVSVDFRESEFYFRRLFDMIWRLYNLPFDNPLLEELRASMTPQRR